MALIISWKKHAVFVLTTTVIAISIMILIFLISSSYSRLGDKTTPPVINMTVNKTGSPETTPLYPSGKTYLEQRAEYIIDWQGAYYLAVETSTGNVVANSTSASTVIQTAIDMLHEKGGGTILIKRGTYLLSSPIVLRSKVRLVGSGFPELVVPENGDGIVIEFKSRYVQLEGIRVRGDKNSRNGSLILIEPGVYVVRLIELELFNHYNGIYIKGEYPPNDFWGIYIERVHVHDVLNTGLTVEGYGNVLYVKESNIAYSGQICILLKNTADGVMEFMNVHCFNSGKYSVLAYNTDGRPVQHKRFIACHLEGIDMRPFTSRFENCINIAFVDTEIAGMLGNGIEFLNCREVRFIGGRVINNGIGSPGKYSGIYLSNSRYVIITNVFIHDTNPPGSKTQAYGVYEDNFSDYNIIVNNVLFGNAVAPARIVGENTIFQGNIT